MLSVSIHFIKSKCLAAVRNLSAVGQRVRPPQFRVPDLGAQTGGRAAPHEPSATPRVCTQTIYFKIQAVHRKLFNI